MDRDSLRNPRAGASADSRATLLCALVLLPFPAAVLRADEAYESADQNLPRLIHFCWTNCFTLQLNGGIYTRVDGSDETWSIERFAPQSIVLRRHDPPASWNGYSTDVRYAGQVSDGQLVNVTVNGNPVADIHAAWGAALYTLPGSNAERDQRQSAQADSEPASDLEVHTSEAPPPLPDYEQPPCPEDGYLWTPGYWAWGGAGYYWLPGVWVQPPRLGVLWTPGYWGFVGAVYVFHPGYWGPHIGYYGGINYGFGYVGVGFAGGRWVGNAFAYNATVSNVNVTVFHNTYNETVLANIAANKASFNGGPGGTTAAPTPQERAAAAEAHIPPTTLQRQAMQQAARNPALLAHAMGARPPILVTRKPAPAVYHTPPVATAHVAHVNPAPPAGGPPQPAHASVHTRAPPQFAAVQPAAANPTAAPARITQHARH